MLAGAAAYINGLTGPFIFDDRRTILDNPTIQHMWPLTTVLHPEHQTPVVGRPLANFSFAVNYALGGFDVLGYHVVNVVVHILAALVLFALLRRLMAATVGPESSRETTDRLALLCAAIWLLHPLNTEAVDYVTQRTESMVGLFYLLTMYASVRAWDTDAARPWQAVAVVASLCGMATKESGALIPIVVVLCDRVFHVPSMREAFARRWGFYVALAAGWILLAAFVQETPFFSPTGFRTHVSRWTYLLNQPSVIADYLRLSLWPHPLVVDYGAPLPLTLLQTWRSAVLLGILGLSTIAALWRAPKIGFWGAWFFVTLAPASSLVPIPTEVGAERRMYLPLIAVIVVVVLAIRASVVRTVGPTMAVEGSRAGLRLRRASWTIGVVVVTALGVATAMRNAEYRTAVSIWETVVARRPNPRAHANLAVALRDAGREDESVAHLRIAAPENPEARLALGSALRERGNLREAIAEISGFIEPQHPPIPIWAPLAKNSVSARRALLVMLLQEQRFSEAEAEARTLLASRAEDAEVHNLLGVALASQDRIAEAGKEFAEAVRLNPQYQEARNNLARAAASQRR